MSDSNSITIDLCNALNATACDTGTLLQVQAKEQLNLFLEKFKKQSAATESRTEDAEWEREFNPKRYNNTIFISGQRGAGKTTFLRSVLLEQAKSENKIKPIAFIDPTLIEVHESILVQIVAKVKATVIKALSRTYDEKQRGEFQTCMEEMAEGLKLLGNGVSDKPQDPAFFLAKALKHAVGGQNLECKFNQLIDKAADILNVDLLIIAFDDVDTNTKEAFNVLELIRKYLTSPKLVTLISGDPSLYSHIVQGQRAKELNNGNSEIKGMSELSKNLPEMVSHLEQQYLAKVLPVEQRIELKNLANLIEYKIEIKVKLKVKGRIKATVEIKKHIESVIGDSLKINKKDIKPYVDFLLAQPIRTVLQILKSVDENPESTSQALFVALRDSYIGELRKENIPAEKLSDQSIHPHTIGLTLFNLCYNHGELETGFYARPDGNSTSYNSSMFVMSNVISNYLNPNIADFNQSAGRFLQLMLAGPAASTIFMNNVAAKLAEKKGRDNFIDYIGLNKTQGSSSLVAHFSPLIANTKSIESGIIQILRGKGSLHNIQSKEGGFEAMNESIPFKSISLASHSISTNGGELDFVSIYSLLSSISDLLLCENGEEVNATLHKLSYIPTFGYPSFLKEGYKFDTGLLDNESYPYEENLGCDER